MRFLDRLNIGTKLRLGFAVLVLLMLALGAYALARMAMISLAVDHQQQVSRNKLGPLYVAREALGQTGIAARNAYIFSSDADAHRELAILDEQKALYLAQLDKLDGAYAGDARYGQVKAGLLAMARELGRPRQFREAGKLEEFGAFLVNECSPLRRKIVGDMDVLLTAAQRELEQASAQADAIFSRSIELMAAIAATAAVAGIAIAMLITRNLLRQLGGEPAYAVQIANRIALGELALEVRTRDGDNGSLLFAIRTMRDNLASLVGKVRDSTDSIATGSVQIALGNRDLSERTEQQAGALEEVASAMQELTSTVRQNADNAQQASILAASASAISEEGGRVVAEVIETMTSISGSSRKVADIIGVIDAIAFQTNILALNAAVEAARAGDQGRGFAVVATEVRNLAQRSAAAAKEIKQLIDDSAGKVDAGSRLVGQAGETMRGVVDSVRRVSTIMADISSASMAQSNGIEQVNRSIEAMDSMTQKNAALVEEAAAAAQEMRGQADCLARLVGVFKLAGAAGMAPAATRPQAPAPRLAAAVRRTA